MKKLPVDCLIPAAGRSSRMGDWKLLLPIGREGSLLDHVVRTARKICGRVILIGGYRYGELREFVKQYHDVILLENPLYQRGMLSSIQKGLERVEGDFFIVPADMPAIGAGHYRRLFDSFDGSGIIRPAFRGAPGHPILCPAACRERILAAKGERLIPLFKEWDQTALPWEDDSVVLDIDTPEDFVLWRAKNGEKNP